MNANENHNATRAVGYPSVDLERPRHVGFLFALLALFGIALFAAAQADLLPIRYNTLVVLTGTSILGAAAGLVGSFAVLRGRALMGDALAHAALPGLCIAAWIMGQRHFLAMLVGALVSGLLGVAIVSGLRISSRIKQDAAIGIVLSVFFGAGVAVSRIVQDRFAVSGLDSYILGKTAGMIAQDTWFIGGVAVVCVLVFLLLFKEFKLVTFDADYAKSQGWPVVLLDLAILSLVALTVVIGLPAVGVVLISALLIIPAAAARFWTDRLDVMLALAATFGCLVGGVGTSVSANFSKAPAGPIIVLVGTSIFLFSLFFAPRRGAVARVLGHFNYRRRLALQDLLYLLHAPRLDGGRISVDELAGRKSWSASQTRRMLGLARRRGLARRSDADHWELTELGQSKAARIDRAYRLWELFLVEYPDVAGAAAELDALAIENVLPGPLLQELEAMLNAEDDALAGDATRSEGR